jgi:hypothetical protein
MSTIMEKIGTWFSAIAFAEAGEHDTALRMVGMTPTPSTQSVDVRETLGRTFAAVAFAEADCPEMAREILDPAARRPSFAEVVGLRGVRVRYGVVQLAQQSFVETLGLSGVRVRLGVVSV